MSDKPWPVEWCGPILTVVDIGCADGDVTVKYFYDNDIIYVLDITKHWIAPNRLRGSYINSDGEAV